MLAIFGRGEARDFIDLAVLEPRFGLEHVCDLAATKDAGFSPSVFVEMLGRFARLARDEFDADDDTFDATVDAVQRWRRLLEGEGSF